MQKRYYENKDLVTDLSEIQRRLAAQIGKVRRFRIDLDAGAYSDRDAQEVLEEIDDDIDKFAKECKGLSAKNELLRSPVVNKWLKGNQSLLNTYVTEAEHESGFAYWEQFDIRSLAADWKTFVTEMEKT